MAKTMKGELLDLCAAALTAATAADGDGIPVNGPEVSRCVDLMKRLKDFPLTGDFLVSTGVAKRLRHLRMHKKEKIASMAVWLLETWSSKIKVHLSRNNSRGVGTVVSFVNSKPINGRDQLSGNKRKSNGLGRGACERNKCPKNTKKLDEQVFRCFLKPYAEPKKVSSGDQERARSSFKCCDASRNKVREILLTALRRVDAEVADCGDEEIKEKVRACDADDVAVSVESVMLKKMGAFNGPNKLKYRSIMFNMKDPKNPELRRKVLLGEVKAERLITMTAEEMASLQRQSENEQIREKLASLRHDPTKESLDDDKEAESEFDESKWLESLW